MYADYIQYCQSKLLLDDNKYMCRVIVFCLYLLITFLKSTSLMIQTTESEV